MNNVSDVEEVVEDKMRDGVETVDEKSDQEEWVDVEPAPSYHYSKSSDEEVRESIKNIDINDDGKEMKDGSQEDEESDDEMSEQDESEYSYQESEYSYHDSESSAEEDAGMSNTSDDQYKYEEKHMCTYASNNSKSDNNNKRKNHNKPSCRYQAICERCGSENHDPIKSCRVASEYSSLLLPIRTWPLECLLPSIAEREGECRQHFRQFQATPESFLRRRGWNVSMAAMDALKLQKARVPTDKRAQIIKGGPKNPYGRIGERYRAFMEKTTQEANRITKTTLPSTCGICLNEFKYEDLIPLNQLEGNRCGHSFCSSCWKEYLESVFRDTTDSYTYPQIKCPMDWCSEVVRERHVRKVGGEELVRKFRRHYLQPFVASNRRYLRWCPTPNCNRIAICNSRFLVQYDPLIVAGTQMATVFCSGPDGCGTRFCFRCGGAPHTEPCHPKTVIDTSATEPFIISTTSEKAPRIQFCPTCSIPIEKSGGGCDDIVCTMCKTKFRWRGQIVKKIDVPGTIPDPLVFTINNQMKPISLDYVCEALEKITPSCARESFRHFYYKDVIDYKNGITLTQQTRRDLLLHIHRYIRNRAELCANPQIIAAAEKQEQQETRAFECQRLAKRFRTESGIHSATDTDFIEDANRLLLACRRVLKYCYCYIFDATREDNDSSSGGISCNTASRQLELFYHQQEQLERFTDQLSELAVSVSSYVDRAKVINLMNILEPLLNAVTSFELDTSSQSIQHDAIQSSSQMRNNPSNPSDPGEIILPGDISSTGGIMPLSSGEYHSMPNTGSGSSSN